MMRRVVLVSSDRFDLVDDALAELMRRKDEIDCLCDVEVARDTGGRALGYERMFVLSFARPDDVARWHSHPRHEPLRAVLTQWARLLVFEYEALDHRPIFQDKAS
jgi:hypothetical protein